MRVDEFDYVLPSRLVAQAPLRERDQSRLMVVRRAGGVTEHRLFQDLPELLSSGDLLVLNNTKVLPARLLGQRARTGGLWEGLFLKAVADGSWELMCQTRGRLIEGEVIELEPKSFQLRLVRKTTAGTWIATPISMPGCTHDELLTKYGHIPLPPYIRKGMATSDDASRYQTVYADKPGAVAAPTAGLHFTPRLLAQLENHGISKTFVTLHVGVGTFQPIKTDEVETHRMHAEWGKIDPETVNVVNECRARQGRVVAVGTTTVRVLETSAANGSLEPVLGDINLYIYPPHKFQVVDALITNFHLPRSSLLLLVSAFAGVELIRRAYREAIEREYRFYSYGDAMLIL